MLAANLLLGARRHLNRTMISYPGRTQRVILTARRLGHFVEHIKKSRKLPRERR
jgi:hypothetical protein